MSKEDLSGKLRPFFEQYVTRLVRELAKKKLLISEKNEIDRYQVNIKSVKANLLNEPILKSAFSQLFEFRNVAQNVCFNLYPEYASQHKGQLSGVLRKLEENNVLTLSWKKKNEIFETLDSLDKLAIDTNLQAPLEKLIVENNINVNKLVYDLLEFYGIKKAVQFFEEFGYQQEKIPDESYDLLLDSDSTYYSPLIFEFKIRKTNAVPDKKMVMKSLNLLKDAATVKNQRPYVFLVVFTYEDFNSFEKLKFRYRETIGNVKGFDLYGGQIKYIPVSVAGLHLIETEFDEFKRNFVYNTIHVNFQSQPTPKNFPERNDHFYDQVFDLKRSNFRILIKPVNTKFWRLGFRFVKDGKFPPLAGGRHSNENVVDIQLTVGDINDIQRNTWDFPNLLALTDYHVEVLENNFPALSEYNGSPVNLSVNSNENASVVEFLVEINGNRYGSKKYDLRDFNSCKIFAWAEFTYFNLDTEIKVIQKSK